MPDFREGDAGDGGAAEGGQDACLQQALVEPAGSGREGAVVDPVLGVVLEQDALEWGGDGSAAAMGEVSLNECEPGQGVELGVESFRRPLCPAVAVGVGRAPAA